jgi:signal transduction histidine kinase/CheY-like chemotaxis protein
MTLTGLVKRSLLRTQGLTGLLWSAAYVFAATIVRVALGPWVDGVPFLTFFPTILLAGLFLGWRWGVLVLMGSTIVANYAFQPPYWALALSFKQVVSGAGFLASGALMLATTEAVRRLLLEVDAAALREAGLQTTELRFRSLLETMEVAFALVEVKFDAEDQPTDYRFLEANPAFEQQAGVNLRGRWVTDYAPSLEAFWFETYGRVAKTGEPATFISYAEAFQRWFDVRAVRVGAPEERQIAIFFTDVTARQTADERLRVSEALARENGDRVQLALAAGAIIGTWVWDLLRDRFTVDEPFALAFGLDPALGREGLSLEQIVATVHPDDRPGLMMALENGIARGGPYAHQYRVMQGDGNYHWIEANGRVDHAADGTPLSFPGVLLDIEERRAIEAERDRAAAALRALNETLEQRVAERTAALMQTEERLRQSQKLEAVGQLTGGVAHDFNNLLTIIRSSVDFLKREDLPVVRRTRYVNAISETVERAAKLTSQLLAFARRQPLRPQVFEVCARVKSVSELIRPLVGARIAIDVEPCETPCHAEADVSQFETALVNLAVNARDAMDGEGRLSFKIIAVDGLPPIRGHARGAGEFVAISIADTGRGIPADRMGSIFEPFYTTKEVGKGTGLGLSQVFGFAKQSGGEVDVSSENGRGAVFTVYLPRVGPAAEPDVDAPLPAAFRTKNLRVLVVEDNEAVGHFADEVLRDLGYQTRLVGNAVDALAALESGHPDFDVVFSDVIMPGLNGVEMAREIRRRHPEMPVVLTSGYSSVLAQDSNREFELLRKPYSIEELSRVLRNVAS